MTVAGHFRVPGRRRWTAGWLLTVFLLLQSIPVFALMATDGMKGMACCKKGKNSCCRRKPVGDSPAVRSTQTCGMPCCGQPSVPLAGNAAVVTPSVSFIEFALTAPALLVTAPEARVSAGVDPSLHQRSPPFLS